ncbi:dihydroorotase [Cellulophaga baltica]|uniref:dihydroorotase n=1 Tax=Cellulophaga TaxID=104264 RepID=UPI001C06FDB7|nr:MULTISPECIES: dihydroorotase [Cellulophaga]MBU2996151.1 dihydroorotase [Cellulophaga baltica]MDO6767546.1 dihydroorotase [Cellulophaga sp. 1_MG-2023]
MNVLLKAVKIVDASNTELHLKKRDILIKNGIIDAIDTKIEAPEDTQVIQLKNLHVSIGWFDSSVSFGEPGHEERETIENGLYTAGKSGFTDVVLNPSTNPIPDSNSNIVFLKSASQKQTTNLYPLGALTVKSEGEVLAELFDMKNAGAVAFSDFKNPINNSNLLKIALQYAQGFDGLVYSFPLDKQIAGKGVVNEEETATKLGLKGIPALAEDLQITRDLHILEYTGGKLHIPTISTANAVKLIANAKKKGLNVSCSVALHNLFFTDSVLEEFDTNYKVLPPLRTKKDTNALIKGLKDGIIDFVTTDHTPLDTEEKILEFDNANYGTIGLESAFGILNQIFSVEETVALLTKGRNRYAINTPKFSVGEKACFTLFNPDEEYVFTKEHCISTSKNSAYLNQKHKGIVYGIINEKEVLI